MKDNCRHLQALWLPNPNFRIKVTGLSSLCSLRRIVAVDYLQINSKVKFKQWRQDVHYIYKWNEYKTLHFAVKLIVLIAQYF